MCGVRALTLQLSNGLLPDLINVAGGLRDRMCAATSCVPEPLVPLRSSCAMNRACACYSLRLRAWLCMEEDELDMTAQARACA
jgi:hypothetical protein